MSIFKTVVYGGYDWVTYQVSRKEINMIGMSEVLGEQQIRQRSAADK